jgi:hypothetical protein
MRLAIDPAALAWALTPRGGPARAALLGHEGFVPAEALARLRAARPRLEAQTGLGRGELWDLLEALLARVEAVEETRVAEFAPLARRVVPSPCAPTLTVALALEVDALLAGGPGFEAQTLVPILGVGPRPRQSALPD